MLGEGGLKLGEEGLRLVGGGGEVKLGEGGLRLGG